MRNVSFGIMILLIAVILLGCNGTSPVVATPDMTPTATPSPTPTVTHYESLSLSGFKSHSLKFIEGNSHLKELSLSNSDIEDISALESLVQLEELRLSDMWSLSDISAIRKMPNLKCLVLCNLPELKDVSALDTLVHLEELILGDLPELKDGTSLGALQSLKELNISDVGISDIGSLENLTELEELHIDDADDLSPLIALPKLKTVGLNAYCDLKPLSQIISLKRLHITLCNADEVVVLPTMAQLEELGISGSGAIDISGLEGMQSLKHLWFSGDFDTRMKVVDYMPIAHLENLVSLSMSNEARWDVNSIDFLRGKVELESLTIGLGAVSDVTPLTELKSLESLDVTWPNELPPLSGLDNLKEIHINCSNEFDLKYLSNASIERLSFWECYNLKNLEAIDTIESLGELHIVVDNNSSIPDFKHLKNLVTLSLCDNDMTSLSLTHLDQVEELYIEYNPIDDISFLTNFPKLKKLVLNSTDINDISVLAELKNLEYIDIGYTDVSDISPLPTLENLKYLNVEGCPIEDFGAFSDREDIVIVR